MILESRKEEEDCQVCSDSIPPKELLLLAVATSIDALAVGVSFAFLKVEILPAVCLIGVTTFLISFFAVFLGKRIGGKLGKYAELSGGILLILDRNRNPSGTPFRLKNGCNFLSSPPCPGLEIL